MTIHGSIQELKTRTDASGDNVHTAKLVLHGDFVALHEYLKKHIKVTIEVAE